MRTTRCEIIEKTVKVVTRGGQEFIIPVHIDVLSLFPLQDGVLIKAEYNKDVLNFEMGGPKASQRKRQYAYMTITDHPLNDLKPLALDPRGNTQTDLIATTMEILKVFLKVPLVVSFEPNNGGNNGTLTFSILKTFPQKTTAQNMSES
jgi:hypothetical protein